MDSPIDNYFLQHSEPIKSCLQYLRDYILKKDSRITEAFSYGMPTYYYNGKRFCYLWLHKKHKQPYIGFIDGNLIEHPDLLTEERARMKILIVDAERDIPLKKIDTLVNKAVALYKK